MSNESQFIYGEMTEQVSNTVLPALNVYAAGNTSGHSMQAGDFNGDGISDIVQYEKQTINGIQVVTNIKVSISSGGTAPTFQNTYNYPLYANFFIANPSTYPFSYNFPLADYDGDGTDDILFVSTGLSIINRFISNIVLITKIGSGNPVSDTMPLPPSPHRFISGRTFGIVTGDFDGDGRIDYILSTVNQIDGNSNNWTYKAFMNSPAKGYVNEEIIFPSGSIPKEGFLDASFSATIDFEGDGKNEVMAVSKDYGGSNPSKTRVFSFKRNNQNTWNAEVKSESGYPNSKHLIYLGDFNGDRKTDMLTRTSDYPELWQVAVSNGKTFEAETLSFPFDPAFFSTTGGSSAAYLDDVVMLSDFDGDGKTDLLHKKLNFWSGTSNVKCYYSRGKNKWKLQISTVPENSYPITQIPGNFLGDGKAGFMNLDYLGACSLFRFRTNSKDKLLSKCRDGIGLVSYLNYNSINTKDPLFYTFSGNTPYPFNTLNVPYYAVSQTWTGTYPQNLKNYSYKDLRFHKGGKGLLGFEQTEVTDVNSNIKSTQKILEWNTDYFIPKTTESSVTSTATNQHPPISKTTSYFITTPITNIFNFRFKHELDATKTEDLLQGTYTYKRFWYDGWGNPTKIASEVNGWLEEDLEEITYAPASATATSVPGKPETILKTHKRADLFATPVTVKTKFSYANGRLQQKREFDNLSVPIVTDYGYNAVGLPSSTTVFAIASGAPRTSSVSYDALYRFPTTTTDALGQTASVAYDYRWGVPTSQTGIDNVKDTFEYDSYGRRTRSATVGGYFNTIIEDYSWNSSFSDVRYFHNVIQSGQGEAKTGYDIQGREVETRRSMWGSGTAALWSIATKTYNATNQVLSETAPRFSSEPALTTNYSYDYLNRPATVTSPTNTLTYNYTYGVGPTGKNLKVEITDAAGHKTSKETDPAGRVVESTTEGGKLKYYYDSWGNVVYTQVGTAPSYSTFTTYNAYNRRYTSSESSAGSTQYTYNGFGELLTERDALYKTTTTGYDVLGRVVQRTGPEGMTTYQYGPAGTSSAGRLKKIIGFNAGTQTEHFYNAWGKLDKIAETLNGQVYNTSYIYDWVGRLRSTSYPNSGPVISNYYNDHGLLTTVVKGNNVYYTPQDVLYEVTSINGRGQTKTATRANGLTTTNTYQYDALTHTTTPGVGTSVVQDYSLSYDWNRGLIKTRQEKALVANKAESFSYDDAGRLQSLAFFDPATPSAMVPIIQHINYGTGGNADNIIEKSDVGQFKYLSKQHALSYTNNSAGPISTQTQKVSYTPFHRPDSLTEGDWLLTFAYGPDYERRRTNLYNLGTLKETRHYFGTGSERHENAATGTNLDFFYIPGPDGVAAIIKKQGGLEQVYFPYADHLGSITALTDENGTVVCRQAFDPWGRRRNPGSLLIDDNALPANFTWLRGFTGHEHLPQFKLINMNARLYDPLLGRMLSPDNYVTDASNAMTYNLFSYANNNPVSYVDPDGNFAFVPLLVAMAYGALIGAGTSAAVYTISTVATGNTWNWSGFGTAVGMGALGGAIGGGIGYLGTGLGAFGHSLSFNIMNSVASNSAVTVAFGGKITLGSIAGSVAGGVLGAKIGNFKGVKGGSLENILAETVFNSAKGAVTGGFSGGVGALIEGQDVVSGMIQGAEYGAMGGLAQSVANNLLYGATYVPEKSYGDFGKHGPVYRRGTALTIALNKLEDHLNKGAVTLGRNLVMNDLRGESYYEAHETGHFQQQTRMGFGGFYGRTGYEYFIRPGFNRVYGTEGTLEWGADRYADKYGR